MTDEPTASMRDPRSWPTGRLLSAAARAVERTWDERLRDLGLTHAAIVVLDHLVSDGPNSADRLASAVRVAPQTMSATLDRMERDGLVERSVSPDDRRRRIVAPTAAGEAALTTARDAERSVLADDPALRDALLRLLGRD